MVRYISSKNKNELLVLTGFVYSFVAYLTAFTLEVLFMIDLAKRSGSTIMMKSTGSASSSQFSPLQTPSLSTQQQAHQLYEASAANNQQATGYSTIDQALLAFQSMQTHVTISCLAITILYFVSFVASLMLIIALILRSTFFLLIWMCIMTTMYLPEFGLTLYVSLYSWGIETRNGQTEILFYLCRGALNVIFIFRTHRLFKEWSYEKNFFMLKSGNRFTGYDSPYFIGDSLSTTINPVFSGSTHNLARYDQIRENITGSPLSNNQHMFPDFDMPSTTGRSGNRSLHNAISLYSSRCIGDNDNEQARKPTSASPTKVKNNTQTRRELYLAERQNNTDADLTRIARSPAEGPKRENSFLSINDNDEFADYEMNLDYRTLTHQRHYSNHNEPSSNQRQQVSRNGGRPHATSNPYQATIGTSYSTQSLDRRHLRDMDYSLPDQVILRPLGHQPFEYLHRPGSSSNLASTQHLNTQPSSYSSNTRLATTKRDEFDLDDYHNSHYRYSRYA